MKICSLLRVVTNYVYENNRDMVFNMLGKFTYY